MSDLAYRTAPEQPPERRLVFYPGLPFSEGLLRMAAVAGLLALVVALATFRMTAAWLALPLLGLLAYATRGERHEIEVREREVILRRELWPLRPRERRIARGDLRAVHLEEYDGEGRLLLEMEGGERLPLTEAFHRDLGYLRGLREELDGMVFPERQLPPAEPEGSPDAGGEDRE